MAEASFDIAIIGGGIVGCALARRLTLDGARVVVLEKGHDILDGASKGNSAILHTGFDAPPGSVELDCVRAGYAEYHRIHEELGLPVVATGALVLAWTDEQLAALPDLIAKAHGNGVRDVVALPRAEILAREPALSTEVLGGFLVPGEKIVDPWATGTAFMGQAVLNGAELRRDAEVMSGRFAGGVWRLETGAGAVTARAVINCAGLYGDIVEERLIGSRPFTIRPRKGQFVVFDKAASSLARHILLPVPTKITKGIVICRTIFGNLLVGPTAEEQQSRTDASTQAATLEMLRSRGIQMLPGLAHQEITATYAGLRPATEHQDYQIRLEEDAHYVCVGGIRSTGLSAALGIAGHVSDLIGARYHVPAPIPAPVVPRADRLSDYHPRDWQEPDHGGILCHCEMVTRREVERALEGPLAARTWQGLKRRTRVTMGRCQGFYCMGELARLTRGRLVEPIGEEGDERV